MPFSPPSKLYSTQIQAVLDFASSGRYAANVSFFERDHDADQFYLLLDGYFHIERITANGKSVITVPIPNNQLLGISETLNHNTTPKMASPPWKQFHCLGQHIYG